MALMRLVSGSRPAALLTVLLGALLALTTVPVLAGPAHAAAVVLSGRVTGLDAGGASVPVQDVFVEVNATNGDPLDPRVYDYTAADGTYSITVPATGTYEISIECWGDYACADVYAPEAPVTRSITAATTLDATLDRWARITGTVRKNGVATAWPTAEVSAHNDARDYWSSWPAVGVADDGTFTIDKVAPGTVTLTGSEPWGAESFLTPVAGQSFAVAPGRTTAVNLAVEDWKGFYLRAVDPDGAPLDKVRWNVFSRPVGGAWDEGLQYGPLETGADGRMSFAIRDGREYTACFYDDNYDVSGPTRPDRYATRCLGGSPDLAGATAWQPSAAQPKLKQDIALPVAGKALQPGVPWTTGTGVTAVGTPITVDPGTWSPAGTTLAWQWKYWDDSQWVAIAGATSPTYTPTAALAGKRPVAFITGTAPGYAPATTAWGVNTVGGTAPTMTGSLSITGDLSVGSTATAKAGTFSPASTSTSWQWFLDGRRIAEAWNETITITEEMKGKRLEARLTAYDWDHGDNEYFNRVSVTVPGGLSGATPTITGTTAVGSTLTAVPGTWTTGTTLSYQWLRAGAPISGATGATYALTAADRGKAVAVAVTGRKAGYADLTKTSVATAAVKGVFTAPVPTISGTKAVGSTLTANPGTWSPVPTTLTYQWYRSGAAISGATAKTYKLTSTDAGKTLTVRVTGTASGYVTKAVTSAATSTVLKVFTTAPVPTISGTRKVASTLTAVVGTWSPTPTGTTYKWYRSGVLISGATAKTYRLTSLDKGKTIKVVVTRSLAGYLTTARTSAATAAIA